MYPTRRATSGDGSDYVILGQRAADRIMMAWSVAGGWIAVGHPMDRIDVERLLGVEEDDAPSWVWGGHTFYLSLRPAEAARPTQGAYTTVDAVRAEQFMTQEEARLRRVFGAGSE